MISKKKQTNAQQHYIYRPKVEFSEKKVAFQHLVYKTDKDLLRFEVMRMIKFL